MNRRVAIVNRHRLLSSSSHERCHLTICEAFALHLISRVTKNDSRNEDLSRSQANTGPLCRGALSAQGLRCPRGSWTQFSVRLRGRNRHYLTQSSRLCNDSSPQTQFKIEGMLCPGLTVVGLGFETGSQFQN
jgi:hypothetical protein